MALATLARGARVMEGACDGSHGLIKNCGTPCCCCCCCCPNMSSAASRLSLELRRGKKSRAQVHIMRDQFECVQGDSSAPWVGLGLVDFETDIPPSCPPAQTILPKISQPQPSLGLRAD